MAVQNCCHAPHPAQPAQEPTYLDQFMEIAMKVSVVALAAFSAYCAIELFTIGFFIGMGIQIYENWNTVQNACVNPTGSYCTQGFFELATGVKLHPILNLITNVALTAAHIDHLIVYPPITGLYTGGLVGKMAAPYIKSIYDGLADYAELGYHKVSNLTQSCMTSLKAHQFPAFNAWAL